MNSIYIIIILHTHTHTHTHTHGLTHTRMHAHTHIHYFHCTNTCYNIFTVDDKDWATICGYLRKMDRPQIQQLGGELGLSVFNLQMMLNIPGDMVIAWLRKQDHVKEKSGDPLTWKALVDALNRIGQQGIADDIFKDKCNHGNLKQVCT